LKNKDGGVKNTRAERQLHTYAKVSLSEGLGKTPKTFVWQIRAGLKPTPTKLHVPSARTPPSRRHSDVAGVSPAPPGKDGGAKARPPNGKNFNAIALAFPSQYLQNKFEGVYNGGLRQSIR
jgi:hypothetical protein